MKVGRLHAVLEEIRKDYKDNDVANLLNQLQSALQQSVDQPTPERSTAFKECYANISSVLRESGVNRSSPIEEKIFVEIKALPHVGIGLLDRITKAIAENNVTPRDALTEIQGIVQETNKYHKTVDTLVDQFEELEIEYDELEEGEFEIGVSIPKAITKGNIEGLKQELHELNQTFRIFKEVSGDEVTSIEIKDLSSSEWQVFLDCVPGLAMCFAVAIERIVALYKKLLEIRKLKQELSKNVPKNALKSIDDHLKVAVDQGLQEIAASILKEFYKKDESGRKNELNNGLCKALRYIADRMDHGGTFEVNACEPEEPEAEDEEEEKSKEFKAKLKKYAELKKFASKVNEQGRATAQLEARDKPILMLEQVSNSKVQNKAPT